MDVLAPFRTPNVILTLDGVGFSGDEICDMADLPPMDPGQNVFEKVGSDVQSLSRVLGLCAGGANVMPVPSFYHGELEGFAYHHFGNSCDQAMSHSMSLMSSGTLGQPKVSVNRPFFADPSLTEEVREWYWKTAEGTKGTVLLTAPLQVAIPVCLSMMALGYRVEAFSGRVTEDDILDSKSDGISLRPSFIRSLHRKGLRKGFDFVISSTSDLLPEDVVAAEQLFSPSKIIDVYACTEAGMFAIRDATETKWFSVSPAIDFELLDTGELLLGGEMVRGSLIDGVYTPVGGRTGDIVESKGDRVRILSKSKAKVSGFTVYPPMIRDFVLSIDGVSDASVFVEADTLVAEVCSSWYNEDDMKRQIAMEFPFYSVPKHIRRVDAVTGRTGANERA